jgi:ATP-dependent RNA helicase RhlE
MSFVSLGLAEPILRAISTEGYTQPTPIQSQSIPHVLAGRDLLGCAQTGTGKTAAIALPILHKLHQAPRKAAPRSPQVLVLSPTRELAAQIGQSFADYSRNLHLKQATVFGGVGFTPQIKAIERGVHLVIATPGRLLDLMERGHVRLDQLHTFVLDEADRMLDMGFLPSLKRIIAQLPRNRQSLFFSATMPPNIAQLAAELLNDPVEVKVAPPSTCAAKIEQRVLMVDRSKKQALLHDLLRSQDYDRVLIFTRTKRGADRVADGLNDNGVTASAIHGNKSQSARERALDRFRRGKLRVLVATDLASRGIDVEGVSHVINYDIPVEPESYVHRIGRTGRAGATGVALSLCDATERSAWRAIERLVRQAIDVDQNHAFQASQRPTPARSPQGNRQPRGHHRRGQSSGPGAKGGRGPKRRFGRRAEFAPR